MRFMEVLRIAKSNNGQIGKDRFLYGEDRILECNYIDDSNKRRKVKIPIDAVNIT